MPFRLGTNRIGRLVVGEIPAPAWTPADFTDVKYWWTADAGVTDDGSGNVETWTDQINSFDMQQTVTANMPTITTSATLNGANVLSFNGTTDYLWTTTAPAAIPTNADLTILSVFNLIDVKTFGTIMGGVLFAAGNRWWIDANNGGLRLFSTNFPAPNNSFTLESPASTGARAVKIRYDSSAGDGYYALDTLTETSYFTGGTTGTTTFGTNVSVAVGASVTNNGGAVFNGRYVEIEVAEQIWIENTPTAQEMADWKTYVNNKYGTIIA